MVITLLLISTQQILLLLEMFTFFHQVTFVVVFFPLLVAAPLLSLYLGTSRSEVCCVIPASVASLIVLSVVLLMSKMNDLFEFGTVLDIGSAFPKFSWVVIMIPTWVALSIYPIIDFINVLNYP